MGYQQTRQLRVAPIGGQERVPEGQRDGLPLWETVFILAASLNYWTDLLRLAFPGVDSASVAFRAIHFAFYGGFAVLLVRRLAALGDMLQRLPVLVAFLLLPLMSVLWSVNSAETMTRAIALLGSSLYALYLAAQLRPLLVLRLLAWTAAIAAAISLILIFAFPSIGLMSEGEYVNVWSGAFVHKNGLGQMTALGAIISIIVLLSDGVRRSPTVVAGLGLNLFLLAGSRSLTSQLVFLACVVLIFTLGRCLRFVVRWSGLLALLSAPLLIVLLATASLDHVLWLLSSTGKDASMSSRVPLWQILIGYIDDHFWLGWGYEAFFTDANFAIRVIEAKLHFKPYYSHNGYIELWLALGAVGFAMMLALFARFALLAVLKLYGDDRNPLYLLCFVYVPVFLIQNTAEVTILQRNSMSWCLFVLLYALLVREAHSSARSAQETQHTQAPLVKKRWRLDVA
jgi:exopolysaccharide production protein ExoQ